MAFSIPREKSHFQGFKIPRDFRKKVSDTIQKLKKISEGKIVNISFLVQGTQKTDKHLGGTVFMRPPSLFWLVGSDA